ncbi:MAG TPA: hypothetical protein VHZ95_22335 [Polyangiales bacterium]|nr:hypothetical protein [Polyangiales bacterium]
MQRALALLLAIAIAAQLAISIARAEPTEAARLFDEAEQLMAAGEYASACAKLEDSQRLDPQLGTELHLAHCFEKRGLLASAYQHFLAAARLAAERNASGIIEPREAVARRRAANLEPQLSMLRLQPSAAEPSDFQIELDGTNLDRSAFAAARPIDPGVHGLIASAPGRLTWRHEFTIGSAPQRVTIEVPPLEPLEAKSERAEVTNAPIASEPPKTEAPSPLMAAALAPAPVSAAPEPTEHGSLQRALGYVSAGVGVVGIGVGIAFGLMRNAEVSKLDRYCDVGAGSCAIAPGDNATRSHIESLQHRARMDATAATLGFIVGGAALASGVVLVLTAPNAKREGVALNVGPTQITLTLRL